MNHNNNNHTGRDGRLADGCDEQNMDIDESNHSTCSSSSIRSNEDEDKDNDIRLDDIELEDCYFNNDDSEDDDSTWNIEEADDVEDGDHDWSGDTDDDDHRHDDEEKLKSSQEEEEESSSLPGTMVMMQQHGPPLWQLDPEESFSDWTIEIHRSQNDNDQHHDVVDIYHVHRVFLACGISKSDYFAALFRCNSSLFVETESRTSSIVALPEPAARAFPLFLNILYQATTNQHVMAILQDYSSHLVALLYLADFFQATLVYRAVNMIIRKKLGLLVGAGRTRKRCRCANERLLTCRRCAKERLRNAAAHVVSVVAKTNLISHLQCLYNQAMEFSQSITTPIIQSVFFCLQHACAKNILTLLAVDDYDKRHHASLFWNNVSVEFLIEVVGSEHYLQDKATGPILIPFRWKPREWLESNSNASLVLSDLVASYCNYNKHEMDVAACFGILTQKEHLPKLSFTAAKHLLQLEKHVHSIASAQHQQQQAESYLPPSSSSSLMTSLQKRCLNALLYHQEQIDTTNPESDETLKMLADTSRTLLNVSDIANFMAHLGNKRLYILDYIEYPEWWSG